MLDTVTDLIDSVLKELLRVDEARLKLVLLIASAENEIASHSPGIDFVTLGTKGVVVVAIG